MIGGYIRSGAVAAYLETNRIAALARLPRGPATRELSPVAVVADLSRANGLAAGAHLQHQAFLAEDVDCHLVDVGAGSRYSPRQVVHRPSATYVMHSGAPECARLLHRVLPYARNSRRVGYWAWELPDPPPWRRYESLVDEVWTPSEFSAMALQQTLSVPVKVVGHRVAWQERRYRTPSSPFTVLAMADTRSSLERKNPRAAVEAFCRAFGDDEAFRLVVKLSGDGSAARAALPELREVPNVQIVTARLDANGMAALYRSSDALLSLHRSEGFGLPMLEAMAHGVPVVATGWSGNRDFMTTHDSMLVPYSLTPVRDPHGVYNVASHWAEPDIDAAAVMLRELAFDLDHYERISLAAHDAVGALTPSVPTARDSS